MMLNIIMMISTCIDKLIELVKKKYKMGSVLEPILHALVLMTGHGTTESDPGRTRLV